MKKSQIPVKLSFSKNPWGLLINSILIDGSNVTKTRVETGTTKQEFILSVKVPLSQLLQGSNVQKSISANEERR